MTRTDLIALTPDALASLANRGLVKRAAKDLDSGSAPRVTVEEDGTVRGSHPDGLEITLPVGAGLEAASCTCAATGVCRHQIGLILAYQRQQNQAPAQQQDGDAPAERPDGPSTERRDGPSAEQGDESPGEQRDESSGERQGEAPAEQPSGAPAQRRSESPASQRSDVAADPAPGPQGTPDWSPGSFDDDALTRVLGARPMTAARRTHRAGYAARIQRPTDGDPVASVELPTCTVRFLVPGELGYVHTDAAVAMRGEVIALAVWAFREADERGLRGDVRIDVGGPAGTAGEGSGLEPVLGLVDELLLDGAMHAGPVLGTALLRSARELTARDLHWPAAALNDVAEQLTAYRDRAAVYEPERLAALLAEVHARHRAGLHEGGSARSQVMGTNESAETPLRRVRLAALGCRIGGTEEVRTADVYLAHAATGIVLTLKRRWTESLTGHDLASRRISGAPLRSFAAANIVSETASRSASRVVRLATGRVAKSTITPLGSAWEDLPASVLVRDLRELEREMDALPPRLIRPRVEAELVRVVEVAKVHEVGYDPGGQRLEAVVSDSGGTLAAISAAYSPYRPGALDALAEALGGDPRFVSGSVRRTGGTLVLDPIAVMTADGVTVPDLAPGDGAAALDARAERRSDPLSGALDAALAVCAETAHRGLRHVPAGIRARVGTAAAALNGTGLRAAAAAVGDLEAALGGDDDRRMIDAWVNAQLRLLTTAELR